MLYNHAGDNGNCTTSGSSTLRYRTKNNNRVSANQRILYTPDNTMASTNSLSTQWTFVWNIGKEINKIFKKIN